MTPKIISMLILLILFTIFITQNTEDTGVMLFFWPLVLPKIVLLIISLVIGVTVGLILAALSNKKLQQKLKEAEEANKREMESENSRIVE